MPMTKTEVLERARAAVAGDRQENYGPPRINFERTANLWNALLADKLNEPITPAEVGLAMVCLKLARLVQTPGHEDSYVDIAGYAATAGEVATGGDRVQVYNDPEVGR
jgi:Domain of unknown function (DUF6378)